MKNPDETVEYVSGVPTWVAVMNMTIGGLLRERNRARLFFLQAMRTAALDQYNTLAPNVGAVVIPDNDRDAIRLLLAAGDDDEHALWDGVARLDAMLSPALVRRGAA